MRVSDLMGLGREALKFSAVIVILVLAGWGIAYKLIYKTVFHGKKRLTVKTAFSHGLFLAVILVIVYVTLLRGQFYGGIPSLIPFSSYRLAWYQFNGAEWRNLILNICMFIPFGFMLPAANERFRKAWKTYLAGFAFTLLIETLQLILKRGIFETDDLINNFLGTVIGYGFFSMAFAIRNRRFSKKILVLQTPFLLVLLSFALIFTIYSRKELGNMVYEYTSGHKMPEVSVSGEIVLSSEEAVGNIYQAEIATVEETHRLAEEIFALQGDTIDESRTDIYDNTAVYYSEESGLSLWIDYKGSTVDYTNFELAFPRDGSKCKYLSGADEQTVRGALEKIGFTVPEQAAYAEKDGTYLFDADGVLAGDQYCIGKVSCRLNEQGIVTDMDYNVVMCELAGQVPLISTQEAYDLLRGGTFCYWYCVPEDRPLTVTGVELVYFADTKGFYQPLYRFVLENGNEEGMQIDIPAGKKD